MLHELQVLLCFHKVILVVVFPLELQALVVVVEQVMLAELVLEVLVEMELLLT
jgi:hypothetical protein